MKKNLSATSKGQLTYLYKKKQQKMHIRFFRLLLLILFFATWQIGASVGAIDTFFFSSPLRILQSFYDSISNGSLLLHISITLAETLISFVIIIIVGILSASLLWFCDKLGAMLEPLLVVLNSLPKSALAPLIIVWFGTGMKTIILCGISVAIFGVVLNLYHGFQQTDPEKLKLITTLGGTTWDAYTKIVFPGSLPLLLSVSKVNIGLCLVGVIIGEFLAGRQGLGYLIIYGSQIFQLHLVIMSISILCIIAMGLYQLIQLIEKHLSH